MWLSLAQHTSKINPGVETRGKLFFFCSELQNLRFCYMGVQQGATVITGMFLPTQSENNNLNSQTLHRIGVFAWQAQTELHLYSTSLLSCTFHVFMKRTLLITGQVTPGSTQPWHDNPIGWEDLGRRYGRNWVEISPPWSETHFLMQNKAFILLAVTRKVFVREEASWSLKVQRILYPRSVTGLYGGRRGRGAGERKSGYSQRLIRLYI